MGKEELPLLEDLRREYFWMCGPDDLCTVLSIFGGCSGIVLAYIISRRDPRTNLFSDSAQTISDNTGVSIQTIYSVINKLKFLGLIKKEGKQYMVSPYLVRNGSKKHEDFLLEKYNTL